MAIDTNWVRENPQEAARQIEMLQKECEICRAAEVTQIQLRQRAEGQTQALIQKLREWKSWADEVIHE